MQLNFKKTISALTEEYENQTAQVNGIITDIIVHFPSGCLSLVDIKVFHGTKQILPRMGYISLNDATPTFVIGESVLSGDNIRVDWVNTDDTFEHDVSVIVNIKPNE